MMMAIVTKTGLAPGVDLMTLRPFVQSGLLMSTAPVAATPTSSSDSVGEATGAAAMVSEELGQEAKAEIKSAAMVVRLWGAGLRMHV